MRVFVETGRWQGVKFLKSLEGVAEVADQRSVTPVHSPLAYMKKAAIHRCMVEGHIQKAFLVEFEEPLDVLTTLEGFRRVKAVGNVCLHHSLWEREWTIESLSRRAAQILDLSPDEVAFLFTGVDIDNIAFSTQSFEDLVVWVASTAGALRNAMRAGVDEGPHLQRGERWVQVGTVNILVFVGGAMTNGAMANAVIQLTEAKTGVFEELRIESSYTPGLQATGTGTDNAIVVAHGPGENAFTTAGGHTKLGELIGKAVREAVFEALYKQNGLGPPRGNSL